MSWSCFPLFSSRSSIVLDLMFRSLVYFELIFVCNIKQGFNFSLLHVNIQFSQHHLLRRLLFPHLSFWHPYQNHLAIYALYSVLVVFIVYNSMPLPYYLNYCCFVVCFEIRESEPPPQLFFKYVKKCLEDFDRDCIKCVDHFGYCGHLNTTNTRYLFIYIFFLFCLPSNVL